MRFLLTHQELLLSKYTPSSGIGPKNQLIIIMSQVSHLIQRFSLAQNVMEQTNSHTPLGLHANLSRINEGGRARKGLSCVLIFSKKK